MLVPVYDIANCGPRHRFAANGKLVHNSDKMNLQNLPRGGALRQALCAPEGKMLVACDSSQIEARVVAWLAGQDDLLEAFAAGRDVYSEFASKVYGRQVTKADKVERFVGKTCILGLGYGMGADKFRNTLALGQGGISVNLAIHEAMDMVSLYRTEYANIPRLWTKGNTALNSLANGTTYQLHDSLLVDKTGIRLPNGMYIKYPMLQYHESNYRFIGNPRSYTKYAASKLSGKPVDVAWTGIYGGKCIENCTQALARIVVAEQLLEISKRYKVVLQVHDEVVIVCDEDEVEDAVRFMEDVMSTPPAWASGLPVACEASFGKNYAECK